MFASWATATEIRRQAATPFTSPDAVSSAARIALLERLVAVALEHQGGGALDVDLGYHATKNARSQLRNGSDHW